MRKQPYYFTYGTDDRFPFKGGWSEVWAEDVVEATKIFNLVHPNPDGIYVNCAGIYNDDDFTKTSMCEKDSNLGHSCWEIIDLLVVKVDQEDEDDES